MLAIARGVTLQTSEGKIDQAGKSWRVRADVRDIELAHPAMREQTTEGRQSLGIASQQQQAGCVAIKAMHQGQTWFASLDASDQRIQLRRAQTGLAKKASRFVHHHNPSISIQDRQIDDRLHSERTTAAKSRLAPIEKRQQVHQSQKHGHKPEVE